MADRYAYLPFLGLFIMLCWGVADWISVRRLPAKLLPAVSLVALASLAVLTYRQVGYWTDNVTLWSHTAQVTNRNWFAESHLGDALKDAGRQEDAVQHYYTSLAINPANIDADLGLALYEHQTGNLQESVDYYKKFLAKAGNDDDRCHQVLINLGYVYGRLGDTEHSRQYFEEAAKLAPSSTDTQ